MTDKTLDDWRKEIDALDEELLSVLSKRIEIVRKIGKLKKQNNIPPLDEKRWREVLDSKLSQAKLLKLSETFVRKIFTVIHVHALKLEGDNKNL